MKKINFVKERCENGITYGWSVSFGNKVSDLRDYSDKLANLPKYIQKFIESHSAELFDIMEHKNSTYTVYIYR